MLLAMAVMVVVVAVLLLLLVVVVVPASSLVATRVSHPCPHHTKRVADMRVSACVCVRVANMCASLSQVDRRFGGDARGVGCSRILGRIAGVELVLGGEEGQVCAPRPSTSSVRLVWARCAPHSPRFLAFYFIRTVSNIAHAGGGVRRGRYGAGGPGP